MMRAADVGGLRGPSSCSVVIPVRDMARFLPETIESVLAQEGCDVDLVVVDDGSTDGSADVARRYASERVRVVDAGRIGGIAPTRNRGVKECRAPAVLFLDADDRLLPGALARLVGALERDPALAVAYGEVRTIDAEGRVLGTGRPVIEGTPIVTPGAACVRRRHLEQAGGFRTFPVAEDWECWCRLALTGPFRYIGGPPVLEYRSHPGSMTATSAHFVELLRPAIEAVYGNPAIRAKLPDWFLAEQKRRCVTGAYGYAGRMALKNSRWAVARSHLFTCLCREPTRIREAILLVAALLQWLPGPLRRRLK
jgi:glycosyltransferase involved in cell wall biosynthesis